MEWFARSTVCCRALFARTLWLGPGINDVNYGHFRFVYVFFCVCVPLLFYHEHDTFRFGHKQTFSVQAIVIRVTSVRIWRAHTHT